MEKPIKKALVILILACLTINTIGSYTGKGIGISNLFGGWAGIFLMGYLVNQSWMRKYDGLLIGAGFVAMAASAWLVVTRENCLDIISGLSILAMLMATSIFIILLRADSFLAPAGEILAMASKYSYSIILIHWYMQIRVIHNNIFNPDMNQILLLLLPILGCILLSWVASWMIDRLVVDLLLEGLSDCKQLCCERDFVFSGNRRKDGKYKQ